MSAPGRFFALVVAAAMAGCGWLLWAGSLRGFEIALSSMLHPTDASTAASWYASMAVPLWIGAFLVVVGALFGSRVFIVLGALLGFVFTTTWILSNVLTTGSGGLTFAAIKIGAYGGVIACLAALVVAATAADTSRAHVS